MRTVSISVNVTTLPHQHINNAPLPASIAQARARNVFLRPNKLLAAEHGNRLETRAQRPAGRGVFQTAIEQIGSRRWNPIPALTRNFSRNKLLEAQHGNTLDIGAQAAAGRGHQALETVGAVHRAQLLALSKALNAELADMVRVIRARPDTPHRGSQQSHRCEGHSRPPGYSPTLCG